MSDVFVSGISLFSALLLFFVVGRYAEKRLAPNGGRFRSRFPEKPPLNYDAIVLREFCARLSDRARVYVTPILFPLDFVVMLALSAAMTYASYRCFIHTLPAFAHNSWIMPTAYLSFDFAEDIVLMSLLTAPNKISASYVSLLKFLTRGKLLFFLTSLLQTAAAISVRAISLA